MFFAGVIDGRDVILLYGGLNEDHETSIVIETSSMAREPESSSRIIVKECTQRGGKSIITLAIPAGGDGIIPVYDSATQLILLADTATTARFWAPTISGAEEDPFRNFWGIGTNDSILVGGPYLVRDAKITGHSLALRGDLDDDISLTVIAPKSVESLSWNGEVLMLDARASSKVSAFGGVFIVNLQSKAKKALLEIPELGGWKYKDSLPELLPGYDDGDWTVANHTTTNIPYKPYYGDARVLYGCDYGL